MAKGLRLEREFKNILTEIGFECFQPPSIKLDLPVENKVGDIKKLVYTPDLGVRNPHKRVKPKILEISATGKWDTKHKLAQLRVLEVAGKEKDIESISRRDIENAKRMRTKARKIKLIERMFGWR